MILRPASNIQGHVAKPVQDYITEMANAIIKISGDTDSYQVEGHTNTTSLNAATASITDVANVLCTLVEELRRKGVLS